MKKRKSKGAGKAEAHAKAAPGSAAPRMTARYLRDTPSGAIASRRAYLRESRDDIRVSWRQSAALAVDMLQNSGRLKGAADQVIADTVGVELQLNPKPDLSKLGYDAKETEDWCRLVKNEWKRYAWNASEVDLRGKFSLPQQVDISLRWYMAFGEVTGTHEFLSEPERARYGVKTGSKLCLIPPSRLVQDTNESERLYQGVYHDENGRATGYLFEERDRGITSRRLYPAYDADRRPVVMHIFDPVDATDVRGISVFAPATRKHLQHERLDDATLQTAILQTIFAAILTSEKPSLDAFEAIEALQSSGGEAAKEFASAFTGYMHGSLDRASGSALSLSADPTVSHLGPGEDLQFRQAVAPGSNYLPFSGALSREMARALGVTYGGLTMDYTAATYASSRMETSSIWPVVLRRRERIAAPMCQQVYEHWLDEMIGTGRIPLKGGYAAFLAYREEVCWAQWQGPAKPTADDLKSAKASTERLSNGTSSLGIECADMGIDEDELFQQREAEHRKYRAAGMRSPYDPHPGAGADSPADKEDDDDE